MRIKLWSDIHLEFDWYNPVYNDEDKDTVLIIAGDLCPYHYKKHKSDAFLKEAAEHYRHLIYVSGNHEYYGSSLQKVDDHFKSLEDIIPNYHFLNPGEVAIDDVKFVGGTLWTDLNQRNRLDRFYARNGMNDYKTIRNDRVNYRKLTPEDTILINTYHRQFFREKTKDYQGKLIIVSHHAPLMTHNTRWGGELDWAFHNRDLENLIDEVKPIYWFHGHTHKHYVTEVFDTQIVCNPRGYPGEQSFKEWNPNFTVEI